jgi:hypothetical protein
MMKPIVIPCTFYSANDVERIETFEKMDIKIDDDELEMETRNVTFYTVDNVYQNMDKEETIIWSGGNPFYTRVDIDQVNALICGQEL